MSFLVDEQLSPRIARALREMGKSVDHVYDISELGKGAKDPEVIGYCGRYDVCLISLDRAMLRTPHLYQLIHSAEVAAFYLRGKGKRAPTPWPAFKTLVKQWDEMERLASTERRPFVRLVRPTGSVAKWGWKAIRKT